jgi:hypothetical protein
VIGIGKRLSGELTPVRSFLIRDDTTAAVKAERFLLGSFQYASRLVQDEC